MSKDKDTCTPDPPLALEALPDGHVLRLSDVLRIVPMARATWLDGVAQNRYPSGIRLGPRQIYWRAGQLRAWLASLEGPIPPPPPPVPPPPSRAARMAAVKPFVPAKRRGRPPKKAPVDDAPPVDQAAPQGDAAPAPRVRTRGRPRKPAAGA